MGVHNSRAHKTRDQVVAVLVISPDGIPLVRDPKKPTPVYWKAPGGRGNPSELAEHVAVREVQDEIGVSLSAEDLFLQDKDDGGSHVRYFYVARVQALRGLKVQGDEHEEVRIFSPQEILSLPDFFRPHRKIFKDIIKNEADSPGPN